MTLIGCHENKSKIKRELSRDSKKPFVFKKNGISISFNSENGNKELIQKISIEELKGNPAGSIKAFRFYPEGMKFNNPLEIAVSIPENEIPYRIKKDSLRLWKGTQTWYPGGE